MADSIATLAQYEKAGKLIRLNMHKFGPRSYQRGVGALLRLLAKKDGATQYEIIEQLGWSRHSLKNIAKKAQKKGLVDIIDVEEPRTYKVQLTDEGKAVLDRRAAADKKAADKLFACLNEEEMAQLNTITEKLIVAAKADGKVSAFDKGHRLRKGRKGQGKGACCRK